MIINIKTPRWALSLLNQARYKGIEGGRGSGKSHFVAEYIIEYLILNPNGRVVCIREIQKSLKYSSKALLEDKIKALGVSHLFTILQSEIKVNNGEGFIIFQGMQDHTADSIKSLEGFDIAWVEEAQNLSAKSLELLRPTIRKNGSELWFTWNPNQETDPVDNFFKKVKPDNAILVHVNYTENPFLPDSLREEAEFDRKRDPEVYEHVWLGGYNKRSAAQIFKHGWYIEPFEVDHTFSAPLQGLDFGYSVDPTAALRMHLKEDDLYISHECGGHQIELDDIPRLMQNGLTVVDTETGRERFAPGIPDFNKHPLYADSAQPASISHLKKMKNGLPLIKPTEKWPGSIEDGIAVMKSFNRIIIHPRCIETIYEFRKYCYKIDAHTGEVTTVIVDAFNHYIDAGRYGLNKIIRYGKLRDYESMLQKQ